MPARADVVVRVDASRSAAVVVVVTGEAPEALVPELGDVMRRAAEAVGPRLRVDLTACDVVAPAVLDLLRAERARLVARGGSLSCDGADLDGAALDGAALDGRPPSSGDRPPSPSESALRLAAAVRRRTAAVDVGPERSAAGVDLLALLGVTGPQRPA